MQADIAISSDTNLVRSRVSEKEWSLRVNLAACYRLAALYGWDDLVFTHISARVEGPDHHFLINPYGLSFDEITASSLVKVDKDCKQVLDSPFPVNPAGFLIHSCIHEARADAQCVFHTHTRAGVAVSAQRAGVLPISQQSIFVLEALGYHDYEGVALREDEKSRLVTDLGVNQYLMLRNHGLLVVGPDVPETFLRMHTFESACRVQIDAFSSGAELVYIDSRIIQGASEVGKRATNGQGGHIAWGALLRRLDRIDPSFRR
jgi:ribulose-5-phosphate 4-epimerase/fuculose-1-phosphate aldolase